MNRYLSAALEYLGRGWSTIPIEPGTKAPPKGFKWAQFQKRLPTADELKAWFGNRTQYVAIVLGEVSGGLVCRDFDTAEGYPQWAAAHPELAAILPTVRTVKGYHVYCRGDIALIRGGSRERGEIRFLGDGELRGGKGYCLAPPSVHPDGPVYKWTIPVADEVPYIDLRETGWLHPCNIENREHRDYLVDGAGRGDGENVGILREPRTLGRAAAGAPQTSELVDLAIARTIPIAGGQRHRAIFELARELKAIPGIADANPKDLKPIVRRWHQTALENIHTKPFEATWLDFREGWERVKFPKGKEPIRMLFTQAMQGPIPDEAAEYEQPELRQLVALCRELQRVSGKEPFYLACRTAGELLQIDHATAWRWLKLLQYDELLRLEEAGSRQTRQASRYRYLGTL